MGLKTTTSAPVYAIGAVVAFLVARFFYRGYLSRSRLRQIKAEGIPVLPHSLLFGHLPILGDWRADNPSDTNFYAFHEWLIRNCKRYFPGLDYPPPVVYLDIWPVADSLAMVFEPSTASQFMQSPSLGKMPISGDFLSPLTSKLDIITNDGPEWKKWRSRFNPGFSQRNLLAMLPDLINEVSIFVSQLESLSGSDGSWGSVFQLETKTTNLTFDIICKAALGMDLNEQQRAVSSPLKLKLLDQIHIMSQGANAARAIPIGRMPWHEVAARRNNKILRDIMLPHIQRKLQDGSSDSEVKTIVDVAIKYFDADDPNATREKPNAAFVDRLIANLKAFLFAGHDTTASTICFMTKLLQDNPTCLAKLRAEHDAVLGPDPANAANVLRESPHLLYSLPYTLGVIKETLRLYPLAATLRQAPPGFRLTVQDSPVTYPMEGFGIWLSATGVARHPNYWPRPDDFIPERWTVPEGDPLHPVSNNAWAPFSLGPRNCIGMELALVELRIVSVLIARRFDIEEAWDEWDVKQGSRATPNARIDGERLYTVGNATVHPKDGMPVRVRMRKHSPAV